MRLVLLALAFAVSVALVRAQEPKKPAAPAGAGARMPPPNAPSDTTRSPTAAANRPALTEPSPVEAPGGYLSRGTGAIGTGLRGVPPAPATSSPWRAPERPVLLIDEIDRADLFLTMTADHARDVAVAQREAGGREAE